MCVCVCVKRLVPGHFLTPRHTEARRDPPNPNPTVETDEIPSHSCSQVSVRMTERSHTSGEKEKLQRCSGPEDWGVGGAPAKAGGDRWASGSREALSGAGRGPKVARGALGPRHPQTALARVPCGLCPGGRRSPGAVAGREVQGALWPSGAGGRSGHGDAGGFTEDPRLQHLGRPAAALRPPAPARRRSSGIRVAVAAREPDAARRALGLSSSGDHSPFRSGRIRGGAWGRAGALRRRLSAQGRPPPAMLRQRPPLLEVSVARRGSGVSGLRPLGRAPVAALRPGEWGVLRRGASSTRRFWGLSSSSPSPPAGGWRRVGGS